MAHDTRFTWPRRCDAHRLLPATRDSTPARPFAMLTGEPLRPWQVCDVTRTTFSSHRRAPKALQIDRQHTTTSSPSTCRRTTGNGRARPFTIRCEPLASSARTALPCTRPVSNPFSLTKRSCLPSLDVPQWLIDDFFDGPTIGRPL